MTFQIQQISDYGSANPIVARLSVQAKELMQFYKISEEQKGMIFDLMFHEVQPKMMTCFRIKDQLTREIRSYQKKIKESLILCLEKLPYGFPISIAEIPEAERNPSCPMRFRAVLAQFESIPRSP